MHRYPAIQCNQLGSRSISILVIVVIVSLRGIKLAIAPGQVHRSESFIDLAAIVVALGRFILGWIPDTMYIPDTETSDPE